MSEHKHIFWREDMSASEGKCFANIHFLIGYCPQTIPYFKRMIEEMRKTFPEINPDEVSFGKVFKSPWCYGFTIAAWNGAIDRKTYEGWLEVNPRSGIAEYFW